MRKILIIILLLFTESLESKIFLDGRFYQQSLFLFNSSSKYIGITSLDLNLDTRPVDILRIKSEMEYTLLNGNNSFFTKSNAVGVVINSLNATISPGNFKFTIGRFLPDWSKGKIFRPLDIFKPQTYFLNMLSFRGIDAFSVKYYISDLSDVQFIFIPYMDVHNLEPQQDLSSTNRLNHTLYGLNLESHIFTFDNNIIFISDVDNKNNIIGLTIKGDVVIGLWSEFFYSFNNNRNIVRYTVGVDYSFFKYFFITAEYFYDETGEVEYKNYWLLKNIPRMTLSRKYIMLEFNILSYEDINYGIMYLGNLIDKSFILFPYIKYEIIENTIIGISLYHFNGKTNREFSSSNYGNYIFNIYLNIRF